MIGTHKLGPGTALGRYELLLPIAQGGMATVWAARQRGSRGFARTVAVKTILPSLADDATFEQMFLDEAAIASRIHHPNVVEIYDLGEEDEVLYLVMEWVDGEALSTLAKQSKKNGDELPLRVTLRVLAQACAGLHAAHELRDEHDQLLQLVHRDVSPQNILVSGSGQAKLVDFGVAKSMAQGGQTTVGQLKGKVPFMSPEQARGADIDRRTDLFAMGTILYRLTTGVHPFLDESDVRTMRNIIGRPVIAPRTKNPRITAELEAVILRALQKDPAQRFQTAAEMEAELEQAMISLGGPVSVDEVATYVRATLGDRDRKRRAAIRDAVLKIDEQAASSGPRESVSSILLTQTSTPPSQLSGPLAAAQPTRPDVLFPSSPTLHAVSSHDERRRGPRRAMAAIGGALLTAAAVAGGVSVWRARATPAPSVAASPTTALAGGAAPVEAPPEPTLSPPVEGTGDPAFSIDELPDVGALGSAQATARPSRIDRVRPTTTGAPAATTAEPAKPPPTATATATAEPASTATAAPTTTSPPPPPPPTADPPRLPSVQDPGF